MKKTKKTLIIIDMQPFFSTSNDERTIDEVLKLVKQAKKTKSPILVVEYINLGCDDEDAVTHKSILDAVKSTDNWIVVHKNNDDGSYEIKACADEHDIDLSHCVVCGVNTGACVRSTVIGLSKKLPNSKFEVVSRACNQIVWHRDDDFEIEEYNRTSIEKFDVLNKNIIAA